MLGLKGYSGDGSRGLNVTMKGLILRKVHHDTGVGYSHPDDAKDRLLRIQKKIDPTLNLDMGKLSPFTITKKEVFVQKKKPVPPPPPPPLPLSHRPSP